MDSQFSGNPSQPSPQARLNTNTQHAPPSLPVRTAVPSQHNSQHGQASSSSAQPTCTYPIPIPPSKYHKAVRLYTAYRYEEGLAQRGPPHSDPLLSPATAQSANSRYAPSISTSAYDALTDISSLVSFTEEEGTPSGPGNSSSELVAFDGRKVKRRIRKLLSPKAKAKAALIRCLGSCALCRSRRVPVSVIILHK